MIKKLFTALHADENILYFKEDSGNAVFSCNEMVLIILTLIKILMKMILIPLFLSDFWLGILTLKNAKHLILKDGGIFACPKMRKKEIEPIFDEEL